MCHLVIANSTLTPPDILKDGLCISIPVCPYQCVPIKALGHNGMAVCCTKGLYKPSQYNTLLHWLLTKPYCKTSKP